MDYNTRYYSPYLLGRFISSDPLVPEPTSSSGFNRYRYARNNPLRYTDPSGHCGVSLGGGNNAVMQHECIDVGGGGAGPVIIAGAATVALTALAVEGGKALGEVIFPQGRPVQRSTTSGGYANGQPVDKKLVVGEGVSLDEAESLGSTPNTPPKVEATNPPGISLKKPDTVWDGVLTRIGSLPPETAKQIQEVVEQAGAPIYVVGGYARGLRHPRKDIDFYIEVPYRDIWTKELRSNLPGPADFHLDDVYNYQIGLSRLRPGIRTPHIKFVPGKEPEWVER